jgi:hypothetical protein
MHLHELNYLEFDSISRECRYSGTAAILKLVSKAVAISLFF